MALRTTIAASIAALLLFGTPAHAGYSQGGGFIAPGYGARAWGMGGAAVAHGSDEGAGFWNPALLARLDRNRIGLSYIDLVPGTDAQQSYLAYAHIYERAETDEPGLEYNKHSFGIILSNLRIDLAGGFDYSENVLRLAYAYSPQYFLAFGAAFNALLATTDVTGFDAKGTSVDAGVRVVLRPDLTLGAVVRNAFSQVQYDDNQNQSLTRSLTIGLAYRPLQGWVLEGDVRYRSGGVSRYIVGGEYSLFSMLSLRAGAASFVAGDNRSVAYFGLGIDLPRVRLDYNVDLDEEDAFENTHRFAVGIGL